MHDLTTMQMLYLLVPLAPLGGALVAGLLGGVVGRAGAHCAAIRIFASRMKAGGKVKLIVS